MEIISVLLQSFTVFFLQMQRFVACYSSFIPSSPTSHTKKKDKPCLSLANFKLKNPNK